MNCVPKVLWLAGVKWKKTHGDLKKFDLMLSAFEKWFSSLKRLVTFP
jgi:hypothetical protein